MKHIDTTGAAGFFNIVGETKRSQGATMVLRPGQSTGGVDNVHAEEDQWLYVVSGTGEAIVEGRTRKLSEGSLLLIEAGETHEVRNSGRGPLVTINVYAPPAY